MDQLKQDQLKDRAATIAAGYLANPKLVGSKAAASSAPVAQVAMAIAKELENWVALRDIKQQDLKLTRASRTKAAKR